jgi:hypothetical protein
VAQESRKEYLRQSASCKLADHLDTSSSFMVRRGPFQGIQLSEDGWNEWTFMPKVLGSYESELHRSFSFVLRRGYSTILNIGAAEGYYAVGLAKKLPDATIYAFEKDDERRSILEKNVAMNGVTDRIYIAGLCDRDRLQSSDLDTDCFVLCDIEGAEKHLLDPEEIPGLRRVDILVELHDNDPTASETIGETMHDRFGDTHQIIPITTRARYPSRYEELEILEWDEKEIALSEHRTLRNGWVFLKSKN